MSAHLELLLDIPCGSLVETSCLVQLLLPEKHQAANGTENVYYLPEVRASSCHIVR